MNKKNLLIPVIFLGGSIILISALHFLTPINNLLFHQIYQRLYYIPIILAAFWYGWRGGLGAALFASVSYLPHIFMYWQPQNYNYSLESIRGSRNVLYYRCGNWLARRSKTPRTRTG